MEKQLRWNISGRKLRPSILVTVDSRRGVEIDEPKLLPSEHYVGGLDISMNEALSVNVFKGDGHLLDDTADFIPLLSANVLLVDHFLQVVIRHVHHNTVRVLRVAFEDRVLTEQHIVLIFRFTIIASYDRNDELVAEGTPRP